MKLQPKKREYKVKNRVYVEAKYLEQYGFGIGQYIKFILDKKSNQITIVPVTEKEFKKKDKKKSKKDSIIEMIKRVATTTPRSGKPTPVIDIKGEQVREFFAAHEHIEIEIQKGKILLTVEEEVKSLPDNVVCLDEVKAEKEKVTQQYSVSVKEFAKVVNGDQLSIFDLFHADKEEKKGFLNGKIGQTIKDKAIKLISLFSGCGSMDAGFKDSGGYEFILANDRFEKKALKDYHIETYKTNIGDHIIMQDVMEFKEEDLVGKEADLLVAGIPCVRFSPLNTSKSNFRHDESMTHPLVEQTINMIQWSKSKAFLIENVTNFITSKGGAMLKRFKERLPEFGIVTKIIDATSLGSAQRRKRVFILGIKGVEEPKIDIPHLAEYNTVRSAFKGVENAPQQDLYFKPTPKTLERMKHVPPGGNIKDVPMHLRAPNKTFSNYCQRLDWDSQSPVITHVQDDVFIHPNTEEHRYLTVRETARLFSLPDNFLFNKGSLTAIYEMLKNAVDYKVSRFFAKTIKEQLLPILNTDILAQS
ncbi:DNA cytosine methyltransferase [Niallia taxi]|uniref:DNA cytosine methyltransferase n=1 Tax=Niallia taxi TaxID=2499688 RepID=UPI0015F50938|nr:DNA cytosine methyltransferase [Niallia taxi]